MSAPTRDDAFLLMQVAQLGISAGLAELTPELFADDFDPETADARKSPAVRAALGHFEMIGTLTKNGLLSAELVHDMFWVSGIWGRVGPAALRERERVGEPRLYENFEALAATAS
jgi:hypothetical protein